MTSTPLYAAHTPKVHLTLPRAEWLSALLTDPVVTGNSTASAWGAWVQRHSALLRGVDELSVEQFTRISSGLGYPSDDRMLHRIESCSIDGNAFLRVGRRQLANPLELLALCAHELVHCMLPADGNVVLEEAICMAVEKRTTRRWLVDADLLACLPHDAGAGDLVDLQRALVELRVGGGDPLGPLGTTETVEATLSRLDIDDDALHVCRNTHELRKAILLEYETFTDRGLPRPLDGDEVVLVHGVRDDPIRTVMRMRADGTSLCLGAFASVNPRNGHGRIAMSLLARLAIARGIRTIETHSEMLPRLYAIYAGLGFDAVEQVCDYYGKGRTAWRWLRVLVL
jgi:hypothetical protein